MVDYCAFQAFKWALYFLLFPTFFLCSYFSLLLSENALLSLLCSPKMFEVAKTCNFFLACFARSENTQIAPTIPTFQDLKSYFFPTSSKFWSLLFWSRAVESLPFCWNFGRIDLVIFGFWLEESCLTWSKFRDWGLNCLIYPRSIQLADVGAFNFRTRGPGFKSRWGQYSAHDFMGLHCTEPFIIILPLSQYDLNNVERDRDIKHKIIIIIIIIIIITWVHSSFLFLSIWEMASTSAQMNKFSFPKVNFF